MDSSTCRSKATREPETSSASQTKRDDTNSGTTVTTASSALSKDRRELFERNWSTNDITSASSSPFAALGVTQSPFARHTTLLSTADVEQFQTTWASTASTEWGTQTGISPSSAKVMPPRTHLSSITPSAIHDAARITDWDSVLELCEQHPKWASFSGRDKWTALHHACNRRCPRPNVVQALIQAWPEALWKQEDKGWLPLHYACRFKAPTAVVRLLLHQIPHLGRETVSKRDTLGRTPLYYAVRYDAPPGVVSLLLQMDPSVVLKEDRNEDSPLALVWDSWAEKLEGKRMVHSFLPGGFPEPDDLSPQQRALLLREKLQKESKLCKKWNQANMLLKAAFGFPVSEDNDDMSDTASTGDCEQKVPHKHDAAASKRTWRIVHATAAVKCHLTLFQLACALHPEQVAELDDNDLIPSSPRSRQTALHLAAASNAGGEVGKDVIISLLSLYRQAAQVADEATGSLPLHCLVENSSVKDWPQHGAILYHFYPRAVQMADNQGLLPLHKAAAAMRHVPETEDDTDGEEDEETNTSIVVQLVRAFPPAARQADHAGKLPLHHAVENACVWDADLQALYNCHRPAVQVRAVQSNGSLPLHLAASNPSAQASLIQGLVRENPRAASVPNGDGHWPLHLACAIGKEWAATKILLEAHHAAVEQRVNGWLPLHWACAAPSTTEVSEHGNAKEELIVQLIAAYPEASLVADGQGRFPLHLACQSGKSAHALEALLHSNPAATMTCDHNGLLPFFTAALRCCASVEAQSQIEIPPWRKQGPEQTADLDILLALLRADPTVLLSRSLQ